MDIPVSGSATSACKQIARQENKARNLQDSEYIIK